MLKEKEYILYHIKMSPKVPRKLGKSRLENLVLLYDSSNTIVPAFFHNIVIIVLKLQLKMLVFSKKPQNLFLK